MSQLTVRKLSCGMPLVAEQIDGVRSANVTWLLPAGSAADPDNLQGLAAMWSELVFRGAGDLDSKAQADALDRAGMSRSSSVGTFYLRLGATVIGERIDEAFHLLTDMVRRPRLDDAAIEPTRDLSLQAIESLADDPQERAVLAARANHYPSPINRSGLGTTEGITAITRGDLEAIWQKRAVPVGAILGVAGDIDIDRVEATANELLDGWSGEASAPTWEGKPGGGSYTHVDDASNQVQIVLMHDAPPEPDEHSLLERIVSSVLSGGMAARLFTEVREKRGLCYSVFANYAADKLYGRGLAYVGTTPEKAQESLDVLVGELQRINTPEGAVQTAELERAKIGMKSNLVLAGESTGARAGAIASDQHRLGRPRSLDEIADAVDRITLDDVNDYLSTGRLDR